jgi:hypothetical protein
MSSGNAFISAATVGMSGSFSFLGCRQVCAQPPDEHVERIVDQREGIFLLRRLVTRPEDQHAGEQRPVELKGRGREFAQAVSGRQGRDGFEVPGAQERGVA